MTSLRTLRRALDITQDRHAPARTQALAGRILSRYAEVHGQIGFGDAATWRDYVAAVERAEARRVGVQLQHKEAA